MVYLKIADWINSSTGQSTVIQEFDKKRPTLSNLNQTRNRRRYVNFENSSHFICSLNLNNPESTVFIVFRMTNIASAIYIYIYIYNKNEEKIENIRYWWFAYDVIKNMTMQSMINLPQILL